MLRVTLILSALFLSVTNTSTPQAQPACSPQQAEAKVNELNAALAPLAKKSEKEAEAIRDEMIALLMAGDAPKACAGIDKLIAKAKKA